MSDWPASEDLEMVRAYIRDGREYRDCVEAAFAAVRARGAAQMSRPLTIRCRQRGHRGKAPALAKLWVEPEGVLFMSLMPRRPSDSVNLQSWMARELLIMTDPFVPDASMNEWLDHCRRWKIGDLELPEERWIVHQRAFEIRDVLTFSDPGGVRPGLWVRCKDHTTEAKCLTVDELLAETRRHEWRRVL